MDFLGLLRNLFGGDQKPAAPSEQVPASIRRPAEAFKDPLGRPAAPAPTPWSFPSAPESAPAKQAFRPFPEASTLMPAARPAQPQAKTPQANTPSPNNPTSKYGDIGLMQSNELGKKQEEQKKAEEAKKPKPSYFGDQGQYNKQEMSVDQYLTLTPRQRAAVDANTALVTAAEQDTASWAKEQVAGQPIGDQNYLDQVKNTFGDTGGSDTYAPRTMAVLNDLGLDLQGKDLDQYLNYSALVTEQDLQGLAGNVPGDNPRQQNAAAIANAASTRLSQTLAAGQTLLDSIRTSSDSNRQLFGAPATTDPVGYSDSPRDEDLRKAFDVLSQTRSQEDLTPEVLSNVYAELQTKHNVTPNEVAKYFDTRLQSTEYGAAQEGTPGSLAPRGSNVEYLSPADFRTKFLTRGE